jgi:glycosyltransferase involved in cell wall biosynthesis
MAGVRILYLIPSLDRSGGAEQAVASLAGPLTARGVELEVMTFTGGRASAEHDLADRARAGGAEVVELPDGGGRARRVAQVRTRLREQRRPDLVHTTLFEADLAGRIGGRLAGVPVVSSLVNVAYGPEQRSSPDLVPWRLEAARRADRVTARTVRRFHAITHHVAAVMGPRLGIRSTRIDVIPRGRDPAALGEASAARRSMARERVGVRDDRPLVIAAARHEHQKGLDVLVRAWPRVREVRPDAVLRIGGRSGNQSAALTALIESHGDAGIELIGPRDDVADLLVAADAFVVPSRWEGLGSILIEAMALGAPLVASDVGPVSEVVGGREWARLTPSEDPTALAEAILATVDQTPDDAARRAMLARQRFESRYTLDAVADATVAFYERALDPRRA